MVNKMNSRFFQFVTKMTTNVGTLFNPRIGAQVLSLQHLQFLVRLDGRNPHDLMQQGGFKSPLTPCQVPHISRDCLEGYQSYNQPKIGIGACSNYPALKNGYMETHPDMAKNGFIYSFYGEAAFIPSIRAHTGAEPNVRDYEQEYLIVQDIPLSAMLSATSPERRAEFNAGLRVPNEMAEYNNELPDVFCRDDIENHTTVLSWLLEHNAEVPATALCQALFSHSSSEVLATSFEHNPGLIKEVEALLARNPGISLIS